MINIHSLFIMHVANQPPCRQWFLSRPWFCRLPSHLLHSSQRPRKTRQGLAATHSLFCPDKSLHVYVCSSIMTMVHTQWTVEQMEQCNTRNNGTWNNGTMKHLHPNGNGWEMKQWNSGQWNSGEKQRSWLQLPTATTTVWHCLKHGTNFATLKHDNVLQGKELFWVCGHVLFHQVLVAGILQHICQTFGIQSKAAQQKNIESIFFHSRCSLPSSIT